jgi:hypothetical protein
MEVADNAIEGTALTADLVELATEKITSGRAAVGADGVPPPARLTGSAVAEKCEGAWAPWALDSPHKLALDELDMLIKKGRLGEIVIQAKAGGADSVRILSGFVFAFAVQQLMAQEVLRPLRPRSPRCRPLARTLASTQDPRPFNSGHGL